MRVALARLDRGRIARCRLSGLRMQPCGEAREGLRAEHAHASSTYPAREQRACARCNRPSTIRIENRVLWSIGILHL
jgi:hypothetical protein